jgi:hypothetical protein
VNQAAGGPGLDYQLLHHDEAALGLASQTWETSKVSADTEYTRQVAKAPPISFRGILDLRQQPLA